MSGLLAGLGAIGIVVERIFAALLATPHQVAEDLAVRRNRRIAIGTTVVVLLLYLLAIGDIAVSASGQLATGPVQTVTDTLFRMKAPYLFEPLLAVRANPHLTVFVSPVNLLLGAAVAALAGANAAVARHAAQRAPCRPAGYGRLLGALPALGIGFACCTPTLLVALGTGTGAALLPAMLRFRPILYPLALVLLTATLVWSSRPREPGELVAHAKVPNQVVSAYNAP